MNKKLFFFGIDSATWDLIMPWVKQGKLPGFQRLITGGNVYDLTSTIPPMTPVAWPTITTGALPSQHGHYDFYVLDKKKELSINLASDIAYPFVWEQLSKAGRKVAVFNLPITFPVRPVNGIFISGFPTPSKEVDFIYPSKLKTEFNKKFPKFTFAPKSKVTKYDPNSYQERFKETIKEVSDVIHVSNWLLQKDKWDFFALNFMAVDHIQHFYWEFMEQKDSPFQEAILKIYQLVSDYLLHILTKYSNKYQIMVLSDHGAGPLEKTLFLNIWLAQKGYLQFKPSVHTKVKQLLAQLGITPQQIINLASKIKLSRKVGQFNMEKRNRMLNRLVLSYADLDWNKTIAYSFGMYGGIFLNKKNSEVKNQESPLRTRQNRSFRLRRGYGGQVEGQAKIKKKIIKEMKQDFKKELTFIDSSDNIYKSKKYPTTIPDIQFLMKNGAIVSTNIYAFSGNKLFTDPITHKSADHRMNGILGFYPKNKDLSKQTKINLQDITPTILDFYNQPIPSYCQGKSLLKTKIQKPNVKIKEVNDIKV